MSATASQPRGLASDRNKIIVLCLLLVVLFAAAYNMFSGPSGPPPAPAAAGATSTQTAPPPGAAPAAADAPGSGPVAALPLGSIRPAELSAGGAPRNPFAFAPVKPAPPPPPVAPPPPPPIALTGVSPSSAIAGTPKPVQVTVNGVRFPGDAQVIWNGRPMQTQRVSDSQLRVTLAPSDSASPGGATVEVKSASQPDRLYSDKQSFQLTASPTPTFRFIGRVGDRALLDFGGTDRDAQRLVRVGDMVGVPAQWRVLAITPGSVELLDVRNEIKKTITLVDKK